MLLDELAPEVLQLIAYWSGILGAADVAAMRAVCAHTWRSLSDEGLDLDYWRSLKGAVYCIEHGFGRAAHLAMTRRADTDWECKRKLLIAAASTGHLPLFKEVMAKADAEQAPAGRSSTFYQLEAAGAAAGRGHIHIAEYVFEHIASLGLGEMLPEKACFGALLEVVKGDSLEGVKFMISAGLHLDMSRNHTERVFRRAVQTGILEIVDYLVGLDAFPSKILYSHFEAYAVSTKLPEPGPLAGLARRCDTESKKVWRCCFNRSLHRESTHYLARLLLAESNPDLALTPADLFSALNKRNIVPGIFADIMDDPRAQTPEARRAGLLLAAKLGRAGLLESLLAECDPSGGLGSMLLERALAAKAASTAVTATRVLLADPRITLGDDKVELHFLAAALSGRPGLLELLLADGRFAGADVDNALSWAARLCNAPAARLLAADPRASQETKTLAADALAKSGFGPKDVSETIWGPQGETPAGDFGHSEE